MDVTAAQIIGGGSGAEQNTSSIGTSSMGSSHLSTGGLPQAMDTSAGTGTGLDLGGVYRQCSNARIVSNGMTYTTVGRAGITTSTTTLPRIGSLDWAGDTNVLHTFHGARIAKNNRTVNESISMSYDPRNLICLGCETPHCIISNSGPSTLVFSDQNFVPFLSGGAGNCIGIFRGENFSLNDLADFAAEILDKRHLVPGTVILIGSGSHLFRVGGAAYALDWVHLINRCQQRWPNISICPLVPICRSDTPGSLKRDIELFTSWLTRIYSSSLNGLIDTWNLLLQLNNANLDRALPSSEPTVLKTSLPTSFSPSSVQPHTFVFDTPCPNILPALDRASTGNLLRLLVGVLSRDFSVKFEAEIMLARSWVGSNTGTKNETSLTSGWRKHVVVIGSSNMRRLVPVLTAHGLTVSDLSVPGWLATEDNIASLIKSMSALEIEPGFSVIMELFSNSTFRYTQFDGTLSLPYKDGTGYHMNGDVTVCDDQIFKKLTAALAPVLLSAQSSPKVIIPPLPRYLFTKCCRKSGHATNVDNDDHSITLLNRTTHFHGVVDTELKHMGVENYFVLDGAGGLLGLSPGEQRPPNSEILLDLKKVCGQDGVHYTDMGYRNLAKSVVEATIGTLDGSLIRGRKKAPEQKPPARCTYYWRGFSSPVGSRLLPAGNMPPSHGHPAGHISDVRSRHGRQLHHHPYRKN
jgi:hypothetical protein